MFFLVLWAVRSVVQLYGCAKTVAAINQWTVILVAAAFILTLDYAKPSERSSNKRKNEANQATYAKHQKRSSLLSLKKGFPKVVLKYS